MISAKAGKRVSETQHYLWHSGAIARAVAVFCGAAWLIDKISSPTGGQAAKGRRISPEPFGWLV
jgi:hypothetical protein